MQLPRLISFDKIDRVSLPGTPTKSNAPGRAFVIAVIAGMLLFACCCLTTWAQSNSTEGTIIGTVMDSSGAAIPGATLTLSGAGVMGTKNTTTGGSGEYRFPTLQPGQYTVHVVKGGFAAGEVKGINIGLGFTATVDVTLNAGSVDQTVEVSASGTAIDTQSTTVTTHFDEKRLESLPGSRDFWAVVAQAPGISLPRVDVGGSNALTQQTYITYGLTSGGGVNRGMVEGIMVNEGAGGSSDMYYTDYGAMAEIAVNAVGNSAEMPNPGVLSQLIAKSGGNTYHGDVYFDYENEALESSNINQAQINAGLMGSNVLSVYDTNRINKFSDFNADLGGYIKKDKLWWYGAIRYTSTDQRYPTLLDDSQKTTSPVGTGKITWNVTEKQKVIGFYQHSAKNQPDYLGAIFISGGRATPALMHANSVWNSAFPTDVWKAEYDYMISPNLLVETRVGQYHSDWKRTAKSTDPRAEDLSNNYVDGGTYAVTNARSRPQFNVTVSTTKSGWLGTHTFKLGMEYMRDTITQPFGPFGNSCNCVSILNNGVPSFVYLYRVNTSKNGNSTLSFYGNDLWQLNKHFNASLGVRFDRQNIFLPEQAGPDGQKFSAISSALAWHNIGPRVGVDYDLFGDHKTVIKSSFGMYYLYPGSDFANNINPNPGGWYSEYQWNTTCRGDACRWDGSLASLGAKPVATNGGSASTSFNPNLKNTYTLQGTLYLEKELAPDFIIRTGFVWNGRRDVYQKITRPYSAYNIPVTFIDPGPDGVIGTADDGKTYTGYNATASTGNVTTNVPEGSNFYTWEITASKRAGSRWSILASYANTWSYENSQGANFNPNAAINAPGAINYHTDWQAKVNATYNAKWGILLTPILRIQSGTPYGRTFSRSFNYGSTAILSEPYYTHRTATVAPFDLRAEKVFSIKNKFKLSGFVDLYNIFNTNAEQAISTSSGSSYLRPTAITGPRIARFGTKFQF